MAGAQPVFLWITDPWEELDPNFDTSLRLLRESVHRGHVNYTCACHEVSWDLHDTFVWCRQVIASGLQLIRGTPTLKRAAEFAFVMFRVDPPVNIAYAAVIKMISASLISKGIEPDSRLINSSHALLCLSGRLLPLSSPDAPRTMVSRDVASLCQFADMRTITVFKSLRGSMGREVRRVPRTLGVATVKALVRKLTKDGENVILAQEYLEGYNDREKRVWYIDGRILAAGKKQFEGNRFPPRLSKGRPLIGTVLTEEEHAVCLRLGRLLVALNIRLAGVDLIDSRVTDVNITSPGLLSEMEEVYGANLASVILDAIETGAYKGGLPQSETTSE